MPATEKCPNCDGTGKIPYSPLRALRVRAGLSQAEVAKRLGILQPAYSRLEAGQYLPHAKHAGALADLYGVSTDVILSRLPIPAPTKNRRK